MITFSILPTQIFANLAENCKAIPVKSRKYSKQDIAFAATEVNRLLSEGTIGPSTSPWRAQIVVSTKERHKKRMVIDYFQMVNRFITLDANHLPKTEELVNKVTQYKIYSTVDLKSANHQVPSQYPKKTKSILPWKQIASSCWFQKSSRSGINLLGASQLT